MGPQERRHDPSGGGKSGDVDAGGLVQDGWGREDAGICPGVRGRLQAEPVHSGPVAPGGQRLGRVLEARHAAALDGLLHRRRPDRGRRQGVARRCPRDVRACSRSAPETGPFVSLVIAGSTRAPTAVGRSSATWWAPSPAWMRRGRAGFWSPPRTRFRCRATRAKLLRLSHTPASAPSIGSRSVRRPAPLALPEPAGQRRAPLLS